MKDTKRPEDRNETPSLREKIFGAGGVKASPPSTRVERRGIEESFALPRRYVGYEVLDPRGRSVGRLVHMFVNETHEPEYLEVEIGRLRPRRAMIPVESLAANHEKRTLGLR